MTYVHFEIMFLVEFAELISDGTVSGSGLDTLLEGVLFREGLVRKVRVLLKVLSSRVNSAIYIYIEELGWEDVRIQAHKVESRLHPA